jgi:S-adenosylmethionine hydrolase
LDAIITLTTDFGARDPYVAEMKGAILGIARTAGRAVQLVDVTHEVARHDVVEGALALEAAAPFFPRDTVHVAVIDPGVGTARRGIAVAARGQVFVGPDNGVLTPFVSGTEWRAFELAAPEYRLPSVSRTFHGRDVFGPAAAHVAVGVDVRHLGPAVTDPVRLAWPMARERGGRIEGVVIHVDRFGNLVTSLLAEAVAERLGAGVRVSVAGRAIPLVRTYGDVERGGLAALAGSGGRLEIAVREGSAAAVLRARRGTRVVVSPTSSSGTTLSSRTRPSSRTRTSQTTRRVRRRS